MPPRLNTRRKRNRSSPSKVLPAVINKRHRSRVKDTDTDFSLYYSADSESETDTDIQNNMCSKADLEAVAAKMVEKFKEQLFIDLRQEFESLLMSKTQELREEMEVLRDVNKHIRNCIKTESHARYDLKQYGRRMMLDISGIPGDTSDPKENMEWTVIDYAKTINLDLPENDIDKIHRRCKWRTDVMMFRLVIIKFTNAKTRDRLFSMRRQMGDGILVRGSLSPYRETLAYEARKLKREGKVVNTWVMGRKIWAIMNNANHNKVEIRDAESIESVRAGTVPTYTKPAYP